VLFGGQHASPLPPHISSQTPELHRLPLSHVVPPQQSSPTPPQLSQRVEVVLQVRFAPPLQSLPAQQNCPAALPHVVQNDVLVLHIVIAPVQESPEQHVSPPSPHDWHRCVVELHTRPEAPVHVVPSQQGCPAAEPQTHLGGDEPVQTRFAEQSVPEQHGCSAPPHGTQSEPSHASPDSLQLPPAQHCALSMPQQLAISQPPHPLHVPSSLTGLVWL